jgi:cytochrome c5
MADQQPHSSRSIMYATIAVAVLLVLGVLPFAFKGETPAPANGDDADLRIQPVEKFELKRPDATAAAENAAPKSGAEVYAAVCTACHETGAAGSPKKGDKAAWAPRLATGKEALYQSALHGKNAMPAKGGAANLSDEEVKAAVDYLISQAK